jgi:hypothetical protein
MEKSQTMGRKIREIISRQRYLSRTVVLMRGLVLPSVIVMEKRSMRLQRGHAVAHFAIRVIMLQLQQFFTSQFNQV